jgi:hypothetical protein
MVTQLGTYHDSLDFGGLNLAKSVGICLGSRLERLQGKKVIFSDEERSIVPIDGWGTRSNPYCATTITTMAPLMENTIIASVDSSSIQVAETEEGALYGVKCGIALAFGGHSLMHFKIGPILFYLTEEAAKDSKLDSRLAKLVLLDGDYAKRLLRVRVERAVQTELSAHLVGSVLLVDGSLRSSIFEDQDNSMAKIAENCTLYRNKLVGISKSTKFKILDRISAPLAKVPSPAFIEVGIVIKSLVRNSIGSNLLVKFERSSPVLRADVVGNCEESLGRILGNDSVARGYPETLRLAHHISTFTATEVTCLKSHILTKYDVTELATEDIRRTLLSSISV